MLLLTLGVLILVLVPVFAWVDKTLPLKEPWDTVYQHIMFTLDHNCSGGGLIWFIPALILHYSQLITWIMVFLKVLNVGPARFFETSALCSLWSPVDRETLSFLTSCTVVKVMLVELWLLQRSTGSPFCCCCHCLSDSGSCIKTETALLSSKLLPNWLYYCDDWWKHMSA